MASNDSALPSTSGTSGQSSHQLSRQSKAWSKAVENQISRSTHPSEFGMSIRPTLESVYEVQEDESELDVNEAMNHSTYEDFTKALYHVAHSSTEDFDGYDSPASDERTYKWKLANLDLDSLNMRKQYILQQIRALECQLGRLTKELERRKQIEEHLPTGFVRLDNPFTWACRNFISGSYRNISGRGRGRLFHENKTYSIEHS